ncbi:carnitine O-palmitoyltransferase 1, muscle isoform-like [Tubulanus polymorphus]|uniref:carnitine O-palmitoyltransferase 1, muscle isoform-like n=1 Tax=Tubulanus polymorphus TaxID=672921 RepID=UPI003DA6AF0C
MAEARSATSEPRVHYLEEGVDPGRDFIREWRKSILRRFFRTRNLIRNGMWPTSIWNLGLTVGLLSMCLIGDWTWVQPVNAQLWRLADFLHIHSGIPYYIQILFVTAAAGFLFFLILMYVRRYTLRVLLAYRGWMYEPPRHQCLSTKIWGLVVRLWSGYSPSTYSCQASLPRMPVPSLRSTLDKLLESLEPLYGDDPEKMETIKRKAKAFEKSIGQRLQKVLMLKSWWAENYMTDWWDRYVYLMGRSPIAINSNYYVLDHCYWQPTIRQCSRAALVTIQFLEFERYLDREQIPPLLIRNTIPLCMWQYERIFSTTRIPGEDIDELVHYDTTVSKHIVVIYKGLYYRIDIFDSKGEPLTRQSMELQFEWIVENAGRDIDSVTTAERHLPALTGLPRTDWARIRNSYFKNGPNKEALDVIEKSVFVVVLSDEKFEHFSDRGKYLLHGDGGNMWFDKSFSLVFFADGKFGINCEHSWGDAPVMGHVGEYCMTNELLEKLYTEDGYLMPDKVSQKAKCSNPQRLVWDLPDNCVLASKIENAFTLNVQNNDDLMLCVKEHKSYGKGLVKKIQVSPDAYIQLALQLAYYKDAGKIALVYESSMTRLYLQGRTETVRSLSKYSVAFVKAMTDGKTPDDEKKKLLKQACDFHQNMYRDCMNGKGIDRHLFALYVVCKGMGYDSKPESEFLKESLMIPWTLSTSQQPQQQISGMPDCSLPYYQNKISPGGGFGPVSDLGYGVSYMIPGDHRFFFHVSCKKSAKTTNAARFMDLLFESLTDIRLLFNQPESQRFDARGRPIKPDSQQTDGPTMNNSH